jgi:hypothetical protein
MQDRRNINVFLGCQNIATGKRAVRFLDFLAQGVGARFEFTSSMWLLDCLANPECATRAVHDAVASDILILSGYYSKSALTEVKSEDLGGNRTLVAEMRGSSPLAGEDERSFQG